MLFKAPTSSTYHHTKYNTNVAIENEAEIKLELSLAHSYIPTSPKCITHLENGEMMNNTHIDITN